MTYLDTRVASITGAGIGATAMASLAYAVNTINQQYILLVGQDIKAALVLTDTQLGLAFGFSYMAFSGLFALPLGRLADRYPRRLVIGLSLGVMSLASCATAYVQSFVALIVFRAVAGAGDAGVVPAGTAAIGSSVPPRHRAAALSIFGAAAALGAFACYRYFGAVAFDNGWRRGYLVVGLLGLVVSVAILLGLPEARRGEPASGHERAHAAFAALFRIRSYRYLVIALVLMGFTSSATWNWLIPVLQRHHGFSVKAAGELLAFGFGIWTVAGSLAYGFLAAALRPRSILNPLRLGIAFYAIAAILFAAAIGFSDRVHITIGISASLFFAGPSMAIVLSAIQDVIPARSTAYATGMAMLFFSLIGQGLGPISTGALSDLWSDVGPSTVATITQVTMILCSTVVIVFLAAAMRHVLLDYRIEAADAGDAAVPQCLRNTHAA